MTGEELAELLTRFQRAVEESTKQLEVARRLFINLPSGRLDGNNWGELRQELEVRGRTARLALADYLQFGDELAAFAREQPEHPGGAGVNVRTADPTAGW